jgi:hypothetical protein
MSEEEFELFSLEQWRNLATAIAERVIEYPNEYLCGNSTPEQQAKYYHDCIEAAERYDQRLGELRLNHDNRQ